MIQQKFAHLISRVLHPTILTLLIPIIVEYKQTANAVYGLGWGFFSLIFLLFAGCLFYFLTPRNASETFEDILDITSQKKREIFYAVCMLSVILFCVVTLILQGILFPLTIISLGATLGIAIFSLINFFIKISIHTAVVVAFVTTICFLYGFFSFLGIVLVLPLLIWSRLTLNKHNKREIVVGFLVGLIIPIATLLIYKSII
ncbi:MAG TPA: hypothetical protein VLB73_02050 [Patescibacteria group bacterium]|nr:hypothetical protein [Patescibacteria group bacterium]